MSNTQADTQASTPATARSGPSVAIIGTRGYPSYYGGFETAVRELAPHLARRGWDVSVYGRRDAVRTDDPLADDAVTSRLTPGIERRALSTLTYGGTATLDAARRRPDVALVMNVANGYYLPLLRARGIPTLVNVDGIEWEREKWGSAARRVFRTGARLTARYADELVVDAHAIGDHWQREFGRSGVFIPYGGRFREPLPVEPGLSHRGYVLMVARFVPENSVPEFLAAAETLARHWPVVIVGSSGYGGELDAHAARLALTHDRVQWLGHVADDDRLHALWQHAGAYFHGHSVGGTNPALVQAMALEAPTVARDTVFTREVLGDSGAFTDADPEAITAAIGAVMSDPDTQERLAVGARARAERTYTWDLVNAGYEEALLALLGRPAPHEPAVEPRIEVR